MDLAIAVPSIFCAGIADGGEVEKVRREED
jgi:hypothetical protein